MDKITGINQTALDGIRRGMRKPHEAKDTNGGVVEELHSRFSRRDDEPPRGN